MTALAPPRLRTGAPRAWLRLDHVTLVSSVIALLFAIPAKLIIGPIGALGTPSVLAAVVALVWWLVWALRDPLPMEGHPIRFALAAYVLWLLVTYAGMELRLPTPLEYNQAHRGFIRLFAFIGVGMLVMRIDSRDDLQVIVRRLVLGGGLMGLLGVIQFQTGTNPADYLRSIPFLSSDQALNLGARSIFNRPLGTATHPIEYGVMCGSMLPLALHQVFYGRRKRIDQLAVFGLAAGTTVALSRSGILSVIVAVGITALGWSWPRRRQVATWAAGGLVVSYVLVPGLVGTILNMFRDTDDDPSIQARLSRLPRAYELLSEQPIMGRGYGTYNNATYFLLDNELMESLIETGFVGMLVLSGLLITVAVTARRTVRRTSDPRLRHLTLAAAGSLGGITVSLVTFSAFFYTILFATIWILMGVVGCAFRLARQEPQDSRRPRIVAVRKPGIVPPWATPVARETAERSG